MHLPPTCDGFAATDPSAICALDAYFRAARDRRGARRGERRRRLRWRHARAIRGLIFAPGPPSLGLRGLQADPGSVGDFGGTVALVYRKGRATGGDGHRFMMQNDMRIMKGTYRAVDGSLHSGTFAFT